MLFLWRQAHHENQSRICRRASDVLPVGMQGGGLSNPTFHAMVPRQTVSTAYLEQAHRGVRMPMTRWSAVFPLTPVAKGRGRVGMIAGKARVFTPAKTRKAEGELRYFISQNEPVMFDGPICVALDFYILRPPSVSAKKRPHPSSRPDLDNMIKLATDAANGILWKDDAQIVTLLARKIYGSQASTKITVWKKDRTKLPGRCG